MLFITPVMNGFCWIEDVVRSRGDSQLQRAVLRSGLRVISLVPFGCVGSAGELQDIVSHETVSWVL